MKIWEKVNTITGNDSKSRNIIEYINAGSRFLLASLPEKFLWSVSSSVDVNGWASGAASSTSVSEGSSVAYDKILAVYRENGSDANGNKKKRIAKEVQDDEIHSFDDSTSLLAPTNMFPKFYKLDGKIYIKPMPDYNASSNTQTYTKVGASSTTSVSASGGDKGVIIYAVAPVVDENTSTWILAEYENVALYYAASLDSLYLCATYRGNALTSLTNVNTSTTGNLANFRSTIASYNPPSAPVGLSLTWDNLLGDLPSDWAFTEELASFDVNSVLPSAEDLAITKTVDEFSVTETLPTFNAPVVNSVLTNIEDALTKAKNTMDTGFATDEVSGTGDDANAKSVGYWLADEDAEMSSATLQSAQQEISRANAEVGKERLKLEEFGTAMTKEKERFNASITNFQQEVNRQSAKIEAQVKALQSQVSEKAKVFEDKIAKFQADVQKSTSKSSADTAKFNALLQKEQLRYQAEMSKFTSKLQEQTSEYQSKIQKHQSDIQEYAAKVNANSSEFQSKLAEAKTYLEEAGTNMQLADKYSLRANEEMQKSGLFYQRAVSELAAITGAGAADMQKQQAQRQEQGATT